MRRLIAAFGLIIATMPLLAGEASQVVASARLVDTGRQAVESRLAADAEHATLTVIGSPDDVPVGVGRVMLKARAIAGQWPRSRVGVPVDIVVDGRVVRSTTVWFAVSLPREAPAYSEDLPLGTLAATIHPQRAEVDVAAIKTAPIDDMRDVDGMRLRRPVRAGAPVLLADFERMPDVDRNQRVSVMVTSGAIHLAARGVANAAANQGEVVSVVVDGADASVKARVTSKGVVEVVQ